jgi:endonuclease YncB( thermonuclease family)
MVFLAALTLVLFAMRVGGFFDPVTGGPRVIDGDSLILSGERETEVRLNGIDAPEYRQSCLDENGRDWACGREAAQFLRGLVEDRRIDCQPVDRDRYGRMVADCRADGLSLNEEMLRQGYAVAYRNASPHRLALEAEARKSKRGIWRGRFELPNEWRERHRPLKGNAAEFDED